MAQIKKQVTIKYSWWSNDHDLEQINAEHIEVLEESAMDRIIEMMKDGYTSGELSDNIRMHDSDPEDGIGYTGWWEINTKTD